MLGQTNTATHRVNRPSLRLATRWLAVLGAAFLLVTAVFVGGVGSSQAQALDLPTWSDVQAAKKNQATAAAKVKEIKNLIAQGEAELVRLQEESAKASAKAEEAERAFQIAAAKSDELDAEAEASRELAAEASKQAASLVSQMYRSGGVDRNLELFLETDGDTADALLERLAAMSLATERNTKISNEAEQTMNTATSLGEQAEVARAERETLSAEAEKAAEAAAQAAAAQVDKIAAQQEQQTLLKAQLAALEDKTTKTVSGYQERLRLEAEAKRKAEEEAAQNGGGGGNAGGGWRVPIPYTYISTFFHTTSAVGTWHTGVDLVNGCGTNIRAAKSGTVAFSGYKDRMGGNMVYINHSDGYSTRYAHLQSWFPVRYGQHVNQGQIIGKVGVSGASLGCHLHYEVLRWGSFVNPYPNYV